MLSLFEGKEMGRVGGGLLMKICSELASSNFIIRLDLFSGKWTIFCSENYFSFISFSSIVFSVIPAQQKKLSH